MKLTQDDKGRHVIISLDPKKDQSAQALGATKIRIRGKIVRVGEDFVEIDAYDWVALPHVAHSDLHTIEFSEIIGIELFAK